jgi:cysteinyl-tRNA synthetase
VPQTVEDALLDDLNTPLAIANLHEMANELNIAKLTNELNIAGSSAEQSLSQARLLAAGNALGLLQQDPEAWFKGQPANQSGPTDADIETKIAARIAARKTKNYAESDRIRDALAAQGVILEDGAGGTTWRRG